MPALKKIFYFLSLIIFFGFLLRKNVFAFSVTITSSPPSVAKLEKFEVVFESELDVSSEYYLKVRIGKESETPNKGQTYNSSTDVWLNDSGSSWTDFPTRTTDSAGNLTTTIEARAKDSIDEGINKLTIRVR